MYDKSMSLSAVATTFSALILISCYPPVDDCELTQNKKSYKISSQKAKQLLGNNRIETSPQLKCLSDEELPVIRVIKTDLKDFHDAYKLIDPNQVAPDVTDRGASLIYSIDKYLFSFFKASGSWGMYNFKEIHRRPSLRRINDDRLVDTALVAIADFKNVDLTEDEELTVEGIGIVRSATYGVVADADDVQLDGESIMGYTVLIGRTYDGIPILGSRFLVELSSRGEIQGYKNYLRPITDEVATVDVIPKDELHKKIIAEIEQNGLGGKEDIEKIRCGYYEASTISTQKYLQPSCIAYVRTFPTALGQPVQVPAIVELYEPLQGYENTYQKPPPLYPDQVDPDEIPN